MQHQSVQPGGTTFWGVMEATFLVELLFTFTTTYLCSQIGDDNELLQQILGQNVRVASVLHIVRIHIDVLRAKMQVRRRDCANAPFRFRRKRLKIKKRNLQAAIHNARKTTHTARRKGNWDNLSMGG